MALALDIKTLLSYGQDLAKVINENGNAEDEATILEHLDPKSIGIVVGVVVSHLNADMIEPFTRAAAAFLED